MLKIICVTLLGQFWGGKYDSLQVVKRAQFVNYVDSLQKTKILEAGTLAVSIKNCKTGEKIVNYNAEKALKPASNIKLLSTGTALEILGENYRFKTLIEHTGTIKNDTLFGDIFIKGGGDPTLGTKRYDGFDNYPQLMERWASAIKSLNIKHIQGKIKYDISIFSDQAIHETWPWGDLGNYYGAGIYGLNLNENYTTAFFNSGKISGSSAELLSILPEIQNAQIRNEVKALKETRGDEVYFYASPLSNDLLATGSIPLKRQAFSVKAAIPNPPQTCVDLLKKQVGSLNISISEKQYADTLHRSLIFKTDSPSLFEICTAANFESINLSAEACLKIIGAEKYGEGTFEKSIEGLKAHWQSQGIDLQHFDMRDGSGLSPSNAVSTRHFTDILATLAKNRSFTAFYQSIPVVGEDGTVKNMAKKTKAAGNVRAKSGTLNKVKAYSGYFTAANGDIMAFSMIANQFDSASSQINKILEGLMVKMVEL